MADVAALHTLMTSAVPFARVLGVRVAVAEDERVEVLLPEAAERLNHVGTVHAAAQFGLGESAAGAMVVAAFGALQAEGFVPLAASATISYKRPASGELRGVATLALAEQQRIQAEALANGRARFAVPVELRDATGALTTQMQVEWVLLRRPSGA